MWDLIFNIYEQTQKSKSLQAIQSDIKEIQQKFMEQTKKFQQELLSYFQSKYKNKFFGVSRIIKNAEEQKILTGYFNKKLKQVQLLYRASQNEFSAAKFNEKCSNYQHTLTICQTTDCRILGGYTALKWNQKSGYATDSQNRSFIFALQNDEKLIVKQNSGYQIFCSQNNGPTFGGNYDFYISDKSNITSSSYIYPGYTYQYENKDEGTKKRIASAYPFTTKQWQVWKVVFE